MVRRPCANALRARMRRLAGDRIRLPSDCPPMRQSSCHSCSERTDGLRERSERIASHAALAADIVVVYDTRFAIAAWRSV